MKAILSFLGMLCLSLTAAAQPGSLDSAFASSGTATHGIGNKDAIFKRVRLLPDGKFMALRNYAILRYNANGTLDSTFDGDGLKTLVEDGSDFVVLPDGDFVLKMSSSLKRYDSDGSLDMDWGERGAVNLEVAGVVLTLVRIELDGKGRIVLAGGARYGTNPVVHTTLVVRLTADGALDPSFHSGAGLRIQVFGDGVNRRAEYLAVDGSDRIVLGVGVSGPPDDNDILLRYKEEGGLDLTFGGGDGQYDLEKEIGGLAASPTGAIGYISLRDGSNGAAPQVCLLLADGTPKGCTSYNNGTYEKGAVTFQPDGKLVGALSWNSRIRSIRVRIDGKPDSTWGNNGTAEVDLDGYVDPRHLFYHNRRIFLSGAGDVSYGTSGSILSGSGLLLALDATALRLKCNNFHAGDLTPTAPTGTCAFTAMVDRFDPQFIPSDGTGTVTYELKRGGIVVGQGTGSVKGLSFPVGETDVRYTYTDITRQHCTFKVQVQDKEAPGAAAKNITIQLNASGNATVLASAVDNGSSDACSIKTLTLSKSSFSCSDIGPNTVTLTVTDNSNNTATATAVITVEDKTAPLAKAKSINRTLDGTGQVTITAADLDDGSADACGAVQLSLSQAVFTCSNVGPNTVTLTVTDPNGNSATTTATVTITDVTPPSISNVIASPAMLWPADRKLKTITLNTGVTDNCPGTTCAVTGIMVKSGLFAGDQTTPDYIISGPNTVSLRSEIPRRGEKRIYTVFVTCTDASGNTSSSSADVVVANNITSPTAGAVVRIGSTVTLAGEYWDVPGKKHTAKWLVDDKGTTATLTEPVGEANGVVKGAYKFTAAGVYKLQMNVTDQTGFTTYASTAENLESMVVVYDPNGGYAYGGGTFHSPAGALRNHPATAGEVSYGFTVNYYKGASLPKGEVQFDFKLGNFEYTALNFDYLAIAGGMAHIKGTGRIVGGQSGIPFILTVTDGQLDGSGVDKIRLQIFNKNTGQVYYDNQPGAGEAAHPVTPVSNGSTIAISHNNPLTTSAPAITGHTGELATATPQAAVVETLQASVTPNPSPHQFRLHTKSGTGAPLTIRITDYLGRLVEIRTGLPPNGTHYLGERYQPGIYLVEVTQEDKRVIRMLVKGKKE